MILFLLKKKTNTNRKILEGHISKYLITVITVISLCFSLLSKMLTICMTLNFY